MRGYIPNQHGAWAMLIVPFLFGTFAATPNWTHVLLFACWLLIYLLSFALLQLVKTGKKNVYLRPVIVYGAALVPPVALLLWLRPDLAPFAALFAPLFAVNWHYAARNRERAFWNDLAAVIQFSFIVFVAYRTGGGTDWRLAAELFALSVLYFTGTIFYVKTMIREKHNPRYYRLSVGYHLLLLAAVGLLFPWLLLVPLSILLLRAVVSPRTRMSVKQSGILEIVYACVISGSALLAYV